MPAPANQAIFLSYAHEDTDAARRIADALRSHGLEVWFDQNELRGGDTWDAKIRRQIKESTSLRRFDPFPIFYTRRTIIAAFPSRSPTVALT